jgi:hypothetical protein
MMTYGFYEETYDNLPSIATLGTGDGKTAFTVLTYPGDKKTAIGFGYGEGKGVGVLIENIEGVSHDKVGVKFQVKFESVGSIDSMINTLLRIREHQAAYEGLPNCDIVQQERQEGANSNTGHGHVWPRPDGIVARCGGPWVCPECAMDVLKSVKKESQ